MAGHIKLLLWCMLTGTLIAGCTNTLVQEPTPMATQAIVQQLAVKETTILRLEDGWEIGLQMIYQGEFTDAQGQPQNGPIARASIGNRATGQVETLELYEGAVFQAGKSYQVLEIKPNTSLSSKPGSSNGHMVIGELP